MAAKNIRVNEMAEKELKSLVESLDLETEMLVTNQYNRIMNAIKRETERQEKLVITKNGATVYGTTGNALVDFNARTTELRYADSDVVKVVMAKAYAEDPIKAVKLLFQNGDIREGKGERKIFNNCMDWLVDNHPMVAIEVLPLIPEYTRWDYLVRHTISANEKVSECATDIVVKQFEVDRCAAEKLDEGELVNISLLAKWMPSLQTKKSNHKAIVRHLLKALHMQERDYRKILSVLRGHLNVIEKAMSCRDYDAIDMEKMTSKQQLRYAAFMKRVMAEKRHEYIQAVLRGEKKMNTSVLNPLEIYHSYQNNTKTDRWSRTFEYSEDYEALWSLLPDHTSGNGNTLVIRDGSYSMTSQIGQGSSATMLDAASAMSIYCAERLNGAFKNKFITFSSRPQFVDMSECKNLYEKMELLSHFDDCSNTDIEATFDLILFTAIENELSQDELPSYLMILSDMEFDAARGASRWDAGISRDTLFETIRKKWNIAGYKMPTLVFWQLNGRRTLYPEIDEKNGIVFLSGFTTTELELVMAGKYEEIVEVTEEVKEFDAETGEMTTVIKSMEQKRMLSPKEQLDLKLSADRYNAVESAVVRGIQMEKESA